MKLTDTTRIRELIDRISRISASEEWSEELNPAQHSVLAYLTRANQFSRSPSTIADYMCTTRGTASQTLKALERKGFVVQHRSTTDRRSITFEATKKGRDLIARPRTLVTKALGALDTNEVGELSLLLEKSMGNLLSLHHFKLFGVCKTCRYHRTSGQNMFCDLLNVSLTKSAKDELCCEHQVAENEN